MARTKGQRNTLPTDEKLQQMSSSASKSKAAHHGSDEPHTIFPGTNELKNELQPPEREEGNQTEPSTTEMMAPWLPCQAADELIRPENSDTLATRFD